MLKKNHYQCLLYHFRLVEIWGNLERHPFLSSLSPSIIPSPVLVLFFFPRTPLCSNSILLFLFFSPVSLLLSFPNIFSLLSFLLSFPRYPNSILLFPCPSFQYAFCVYCIIYLILFIRFNRLFFRTFLFTFSFWTQRKEIWKKKLRNQEEEIIKRGKNG